MGLFVDEYKKQQKEDLAMLILKNIVERHKTERNVLTAYASILNQHQKKDEAIAIYQQIAAQNPKDVNTQTMLAEQMDFAGKSEEADKLLEAQAARADITDNERYVVRRRLANLYRKQSKSAQAIALFQVQIKTHPDDYFSTISLAQLLMDANRPAEAVPLYNTLLQNKTYPTQTIAQLHTKLGAAYEKQNSKADAVAQYREAMKINPQDKTAEESLKRLGEK